MAEQEQSGGDRQSVDRKVDEGRSGAGREQDDSAGATGAGRGGTMPGGLTDTGLNPSDYPAGDAPERVTNADAADPQNSRPTAPYIKEEEDS